MSDELLAAIALPLAVPFVIALAACVLHDIRWSRRCAAANVVFAAERAQQEAEAAWQAERAAAIAAIAERNYAVARRGGDVMVFEAIPPQYR